MRLLTPGNTRLHGATGRVCELHSWGALVETAAAGSGHYRAAWEEMEIPPTDRVAKTNGAARKVTSGGKAREQGYTGDVCDMCGGCRMRRNGVCLLCEDCGATSGCS